jgi:hypothetical protein
MSHQPRIVGEVGQFDRDLDGLSELILPEPVPEMFKPKLAVALGQAGIEDQLQGADEVALADLVLADDDDAVAGLYVEVRKIGEVCNFDPRNSHVAVPPVFSIR